MTDEVLDTYLEDRFGDRDDDFYNPKVGEYHASATGQCLRKIYMKYTVPEKIPEDKSGWPHFLLGNTLEDIYFDALKNYYGQRRVKNDVKIEIDCDGFTIKGETDPVLFTANAEPDTVFEVKTTTNIKNNKNTPSKHHVYQLQVYLHALKASGKIVYIQKNSLDTVVHNVAYDPEVFNDGVRRISELHRCLKDGSEPLAEPFQDWQCKFCNLKEVGLCDK